MTQRLQSAMAKASQALTAAGVEGASRDASLLMAFALGLEPHQISLRLNNSLDPAQEAAFSAALSLRLDRVPMSHILGYRDFYEHRFIVTPDVLDPRPDTEALVSRALEYDFDNVLDLGTGSGCILLSLLAKNIHAQGVGVDQSAKAIAVAERNARALGLSTRSEFIVSDWFSALPERRFDLIVSNPPYVHPNAMAGLSAEVLHEPELALTDQKDGLSHYRHISQAAHRFLAPKGRLVFEIGFDQGGAVSDILAAQTYREIVVLPDFDGRARVVACLSLSR